MIAASGALSSAMMMGLVNLLGSTAAATLYPGTRPAAGNGSPSAALCVIPLANPAGLVDMAGDLVLAPSGDGQLLSSATPTWARLHGTGGAWVLDCDVRLTGDADAGQEVVIDAPALYAGAFVRLASGTFSARP